MTQQQVRLFEELSMNAHPALKTQLYDGWLLRFSNGYTKRANSVNPLYPSILPNDEKIEHCESMYRAQSLPVVFKLTHALSGGLDSILADRSYEMAAPTHVMTKALTQDMPQSPDFHVSRRMTGVWADRYFAMNGLTDNAKIRTARQMLRNIQSTALYGRIVKDDRTIACGLCVVERGCAGLFDIVVDGEYRRRGFGNALCKSLLSAAEAQRAETAYLQVMQSNTAAAGLYGKLGFKRLYDYWYRIKA